MLKFPTIPRLSIVVPHCSDTSAFENSLVSVLQHRPEACEIIVPHAGNYDDPFDLSDEVKFIDAGSSRLLQQIGAAASVACGRFVHILADGHSATPQWSEPALSAFEMHDTGVVVPVVRYGQRDRIAHAGWHRSASSACELIGSQASEIESREARRTEGAFLPASFWRRDLLRSLAGTLRSDDIVEASMVYSLLARQAGWRCVLSQDCTLRRSNSDSILGDYQSQVGCNHRRLQAIADHFRTSGGGWGKSLGRLLSTCFSSGLSSALRRASAPLAEQEIAQCLHGDGVLRCDQQGAAISMPKATKVRARRAA